ncbi:MAG: hypothetical protein GC152_12060 [Alphaproteobacteria bacterium]|nr:hypothetical protein [Alphaproteobacteria bacterium]
MLALALLIPLAACDKLGLPGPSLPSENSEPELTEPSLFDTVIDFAAYGTAEVEARGNTLALDLPGGGEGGVALTLNPSVTTMTVAGFLLDAPAPMNLRLTRTDGTIEYLSTENRGAVVLGPPGAVEALIYGPAEVKAKLTLTSTAPCGANTICESDGSVSIRIGESGPLAIIAKPYGPSAISAPNQAGIQANAGTPAGEYGFTLMPETPNTESLLLEFVAEAAEPINLVVQSGETKEYVSSKQGWIRIDPGSTILAYTPRARTFTISDIRVTSCTSEEPRCPQTPQAD